MNRFPILFPKLVKYIPDWLEVFYPHLAQFGRGDGYPCGNNGVFIPRRNKCWKHPKTGQRMKKPLTYQNYQDAKEKSQRSRTEKGRNALASREQSFRDKAREKTKGWQKDKPPEKVSQPPPKLIGDGTHRGTPRTALEYHEAMADTGQEITLEEAERRVKAVKNWTESAYGYIRRSQFEGNPSDEAKRIDRFVKSLTPFKGGIYRGITVPNGDDFLKELEGNGGNLEQSAHSSWSSSKKIAEQFAYKALYRSQPVLIHSTTNRTGVSIRKMSKHPFEDEVLVPSGAKHKVKKITRDEKIIIVEVEEVL